MVASSGGGGALGSVASGAVDRWGSSGPDGSLLELGDATEEMALLAGGERIGHHGAFAGVQGGQQLVEDLLGLRGDLDEKFAAVLGVR